MSKSAQLCIKERDIKTAYKRYTDATPRWQSYWYDVCKQILENPKCRKADKEAYKVHPKLKTIEKVKAPTVCDKSIVWNCDPLPKEKGVEQVYIVKFLDRLKNVIVWGKVGTTTRSMRARMLEELKYYHKDGARSVVIERVYDCGDVPAESLESYIRAYFSKTNPTAFKKNDRFRGMELDLETVDRLFAEWQAI